MTRRILLAFAFCLVSGILGAYDLRTPDLTPVRFLSTPKHETLVMVRDQKLNFTIVSDLKAEHRMRSKNRTQKSLAPALKILSDAIFRCTGSKPVIADIGKLPATGNLIVVGDCELARQNGVDVSRLPSQGFTVKTFSRGIILAGNDSSLIDGYNMRPLERRGSSMGTKYCVYDFIERFLGVRFYYPGEYGTLWPQVKELSVRPVHYTDAPYFDSRNGIFYLGLTLRTPKARSYWEPYLGKTTNEDSSFWDRWRMGSSIPGGGTHCPRPERIAKAYPDNLKTIFYTSPAGNFWYNPKAHIGNYFNVIDLGFADLLVDSYKKYYQSNGKVDEGGYMDQGCNQTHVSFGMCDTLMSDSDVINHPVVRRLGLMTQKDIDRGNNAGMANIYARFHQYLARRIGEELPGKKLYIMAYYNAQYAGNDPRWTLPANTEVNLCLGGLPNKLFNAVQQKKMLNLAREWYVSLGKRPVQQLWLYTGTNPFVLAVNGEFVKDIPNVFGKYLGRTALFYDHCMNEPGNCWFFYPSFYAAYRSMWNPAWDSTKAIDRHWEPFYGKEAGKYLREFHQLLRKCYMTYALNDKSSQNTVLYPLRELQKMEALMAAAQKAVRPGSIEAQRLKLILAPWPKAIETVKNQLTYERPVYSAYQLLSSDTVTVDGRAQEPFWKKAATMKLMDPKGSSSKISYPPAIRMAWSQDGIYGLFQTSHAPVAEKKNDIWQNDTYEVFLSPGLKGEVEYQIVFDPLKNLFLGTQRKLPIPMPFDSFWKAPGFKLESVWNKEGWTAEFFIPFSVFGAGVPKVYDGWLCNVVHNKQGKEREYSGTSMTLGNNHNMAMFGIMRFAGKGE